MKFDRKYMAHEGNLYGPFLCNAGPLRGVEGRASVGLSLQASYNEPEFSQKEHFFVTCKYLPKTVFRYTFLFSLPKISLPGKPGFPSPGQGLVREDITSPGGDRIH